MGLLTGAPLPDDVVLWAVPMVAPYGAVANFKFKVKLQPGQSRKGKSENIYLFVKVYHMR